MCVVAGRVILQHAHCPRWPPATYVRHKNLKGRPISDPVGAGRQLLLNQQELTYPLSNVINLASIFAFVHSCASQPNFDCIRQIHLSTTNPLNTIVRMSRFAFSALRQGISCSVSPPGILRQPKPLLHLNERLCIGPYEDLGQHTPTTAKMRDSTQSCRH
jgi:hypothetical protein